MLVPGKSWSVALDVASGADGYGVLGPFSPGQWVTWLHVYGHSSGTTGIQFAAGWQSTSSVAVATVQGGRPIVDRTDMRFATVAGPDGLNAVWLEYATDVGFDFRLPVGVRVASGLQYIGVVLSAIIQAGTVEAVVGAEVMELMGPRPVRPEAAVEASAVQV